jgi:hypothetical protein
MKRNAGRKIDLNPSTLFAGISVPPPIPETFSNGNYFTPRITLRTPFSWIATKPNATPTRPFKTLLLIATAAALAPSIALAHEDDLHCDAVTSSVSEAGFSDSVSVSCNAGTAIITSNTYPDHPLMTGIVGTNEQIPGPADEYASPIPTQPTLLSDPQTRDAALGVAVNGVPIYDYTGGGEMSTADLSHHQTQHDTVLTKQLDVCGGHAGRGDDYHYHAEPTCMIALRI